MHAYRQIYRTLVPQYINSVWYYDLFELDLLYDEYMWEDILNYRCKSPQKLQRFCNLYCIRLRNVTQMVSVGQVGSLYVYIYIQCIHIMVKLIPLSMCLYVVYILSQSPRASSIIRLNYFQLFQIKAVKAVLIGLNRSRDAIVFVRGETPSALIIHLLNNQIMSSRFLSRDS